MATRDRLAKELLTIRDRIARARERGQVIGETNTKAALIEPLLSILGWDLHSIDEVYREYRRRPQDNPVDYALFLLRSPRLLIEAKGLDMNLNDHKWVSQTLNYATIVGVEWCVLTNGDDYRLYNSHATVDVDEKLFRSIRITDEESTDLALDTLELLSKDKLGENLLNVLWKAHFIDRRVGTVLKEMFQEPETGLAKLVRKRLPDLQPSEIRESIKRADIRISFVSATYPQRPVTGVTRASVGRREPPKESTATIAVASTEEPQSRAPKMFGVDVIDLINAGLLTTPMSLFRDYKRVHLTATVLVDGRVEVDGKAYESLSTAAGMARKSVIGSPPGREYPQTNGWSFWKFTDPVTGEEYEIDHLRQEYLKRNVAL